MSRSNRWPLALSCLGLGILGGLTASQRLIGQPGVPVPALPGNAPPLPRDWQSYSPVVKRVLPAVVCIEGKGKAARAKLEDLDPGFGSGVLIDPSGVVLTNNHVVADVASVEVMLQDGRKFPSKEIRRDLKTDVAIIRLETKEVLPFLEFGDSDAMEVGDRVLALGAPFGLTGSVTQGIVSAKSRQNLNLNFYEDFLQIDAAVNPGNSGGPLVNMEGKVIGLTAAIKTRSGGFQGVGLAVSSRLAKNVSEQLVKFGAVRRPYLGVLVDNLDEAAAAKQKLKPNSGVLVTKVFAKSPGEKANIGVGDIITAMNGQPVTTPNEMQNATLALPIGQPTEVLVTRKGLQFLTKINVEEQPDTLGAPPILNTPQQAMNFEALGIAVTDLTADVAKRMGIPKNVKGVIVAGVTNNGFAQQSGVARGMVILQVDKSPVVSAEDFRKAVVLASREKGAVLHVLRQNGDVDFVILKGQ
jgi:serine protease Do